MKEVRILCSPEEAVKLGAHLSVQSFEWVRTISSIYGATPADNNAVFWFYCFVSAVFNAGYVSGKREERARRKGKGHTQSSSTAPAP